MKEKARAKRTPKSDFVNLREKKPPQLLAPVVMKILFCGGFAAAKKIVMENGTAFSKKLILSCF